jgi:hypothetical protein
MLLINARKIIFLTFLQSVFCKPEPGCIDIENILLDEAFCSSVAAYVSHVAAEQGENNNCMKNKINTFIF